MAGIEIATQQYQSLFFNKYVDIHRIPNALEDAIDLGKKNANISKHVLHIAHL